MSMKTCLKPDNAHSDNVMVLKIIMAVFRLRNRDLVAACGRKYSGTYISRLLNDDPSFKASDDFWQVMNEEVLPRLVTPGVLGQTFRLSSNLPDNAGEILDSLSGQVSSAA